MTPEEQALLVKLAEMKCPGRSTVRLESDQSDSIPCGGDKDFPPHEICHGSGVERGCPVSAKKEVYLIVFHEHNGDCVRPHAEFYPTEEKAVEALERAGRWVAGKATYVHGFAVAEQVGEWS